jgi:transposase-like protein
MYQSIWNWIPKSINPKIYLKGRKKKIEEFIINDETLIKIGSELIWLWIAAIQLESRKSVELVSISKEREIYALS